MALTQSRTCTGTLNRLRWQWSSYPFGKSEVCLVKSSPSFVDSIAETLAGLLQGCRSVIVGAGLSVDFAFVEHILRREHITRVVAVPAWWQVCAFVFSVAHTVPCPKFCIVTPCLRRWWCGCCVAGVVFSTGHVQHPFVAVVPCPCHRVKWGASDMDTCPTFACTRPAQLCTLEHLWEHRGWFVWCGRVPPLHEAGSLQNCIHPRHIALQVSADCTAFDVSRLRSALLSPDGTLAGLESSVPVGGALSNFVVTVEKDGTRCEPRPHASMQRGSSGGGHTPTTIRLNPASARGCIVVRGRGVARGYVQGPHPLPMHVSKRFSGEGDGRRFVTTDQGRWVFVCTKAAVHGPVLQVLGRVGSTARVVKVKGVRLHLDGVESILCRHPSVRAAHVTTFAQCGHASPDHIETDMRPCQRAVRSTQRNSRSSSYHWVWVGCSQALWSCSHASKCQRGTCLLLYSKIGCVGAWFQRQSAQRVASMC